MEAEDYALTSQHDSSDPLSPDGLLVLKVLSPPPTCFQAGNKFSTCEHTEGIKYLIYNIMPLFYKGII